jgi:hypothetical protein
MEALNVPSSVSVKVTINLSEKVTDLEEELTMATWSNDELHKIAETDDLHISPFRKDGVTYGTPTWIWSVVVDDALYVRAPQQSRSGHASNAVNCDDQG